jgi:hypothetical protein
MGRLYGRAGCLTAKNGGFRPGQKAEASVFSRIGGWKKRWFTLQVCAADVEVPWCTLSHTARHTNAGILREY